ncbi:MAG: response regulator transcription factor [Bacteroidia bacterium]|nr:response regulator transcription factor [Bacteroidia bacterium]
MKLRCIAVDDEPLALDQIAGYIRRTSFLEQVSLCSSGFEAMDVLSEKKVDLIFADIDMPDLNGLDFVRSLRVKPLVVFTTAFSEYAIEGFRVEALDFLLKPVTYSDFLKTAVKALNFYNTVNKITDNTDKPVEHLFVKTDYKVVRISLNDIIYIEGMREYARIHLSTGKSIMPLVRMHSLEEQLPADRFMRVHRSFIVNLEKIVSVENSRIVFEGKNIIPVSDQYKEFFNRFLSTHSLG